MLLCAFVILSGLSKADVPVYAFFATLDPSANVTSASFFFEIGLEPGMLPPEERNIQFGNWISTGWESRLLPGEIAVTDWWVPGQQVLATGEAKADSKPHAWAYEGVDLHNGYSSGVYSRAESPILAKSTYLGASMLAHAMSGSASDARMSWRVQENVPGSNPGPVDLFTRVDVDLKLNVSWEGSKTYGDMASCEFNVPGLVGTITCSCIRYPSGQGDIDFVTRVDVDYDELLPDGTFEHKSVHETRIGVGSYSKHLGGAVRAVPMGTVFSQEVWSNTRGDIDVYWVAGSQDNPVHRKTSAPRSIVDCGRANDFNIWNTPPGNGGPEPP